MNKVSHTVDDEEDVHYLCRKTFVLTIKDALNVVSGKWKLAIVCTLLSGPKGFAEIERLLSEISPRMLTRELRELEINGVILRQTGAAQATKSQKYALTPSGEGLEQVITIMANWGLEHRRLSASTSGQ
jgi:DNA-binding HxlR family transcriptional regulator